MPCSARAHPRERSTSRPGSEQPGSPAVLAFQLAEKHGVTDALVAQHVRLDAESLKDPGLPENLSRVAWRWGPEFEELAETLDAAGLEGDAARALRQVWTKLSQ